MDSIVLPKDFDIAHIKLGDLRTLDNGGKVVYVNYKGRPLVLQTPKLKAPFGLSEWEGKFSLDLSLAGYDGANSGVQALFKVLTDIDDHMLNEGMQNGMSWFKRKMASKDVVDALYTHNVKFPKDKATGEVTDKYPPTFKMSLPMRDGKFAFDAFDIHKNAVDLTTLDVKGAKVTALAQCMGIWLAGGKFGCSWKVVQLRVEPQANISGYAFREVDGGESDIEEESAPAPALANCPNVTNSNTVVDTSDDDNDAAAAAELADVSLDDRNAVEDEDDDLERVGGQASSAAASNRKARKQ